MKLYTPILPRRDGTVLVSGEDGQKYVFKADGEGAMACEVTDVTTISKLLSSGNFFPFDDADLEFALGLANAVKGEDDEDGEDGADEGDDEGNLDALPIEAATPPAPAKKGAKKGAKK